MPERKRRTIPNPPKVTLWQTPDGSEWAAYVQWEVGSGVLCCAPTRDAAKEKARLHIREAAEKAVGREKAKAARLEGRIRKNMEAADA